MNASVIYQHIQMCKRQIPELLKNLQNQTIVIDLFLMWLNGDYLKCYISEMSFQFLMTTFSRPVGSPLGTLSN